MLSPRLFFILLLIFSGVAGYSEEGSGSPYWNGIESVDEYAKRVNLPPAKSIDLGNGVQLELVLIPAGSFVMGTPELNDFDHATPKARLVFFWSCICVCVCICIVLIGSCLVPVFRYGRRFQFSLVRGLSLALVAGLGLFGFIQQRYICRELESREQSTRAIISRLGQSELDEHPAHEVKLTRPFYLSKFVITQQQFQQIMGVNPSEFCGKNLPVNNVTWSDGQVFCHRLSTSSQGVRLPSEAEWEYACRAGTITAFYSGDTEKDLEDVAWYAKNSGGAPSDVGKKQPNKWGLYDMHGNVWQWCLDGYDHFEKNSAVDPMGSPQSLERVLRGGSCMALPRQCRSSARLHAPGAQSFPDLGFRILVELKH